ncbi:S-adenosyl-L-methionine-dependent methyltransferase [Phytophthora cactorum]|nr:S-adenosyl-L-methionine-dependent methyltransferase [Phytophthora cactorum]
MPIINRGYYARVAAVESLVRKFLGAGQQKKQYFELDFPEVTMQKVSIIKRRKPLNGPLGLDSPKDFMAAVSSGYTELNVPGYICYPVI